MSALAPDIEQIRNDVIDLGYAREKNREEAEKIADSISALLTKADAEGISRSEFARLLGIDRSTLYKVYLKEG